VCVCVCVDGCEGLRGCIQFKFCFEQTSKESLFFKKWLMAQCFSLTKEVAASYYLRYSRHGQYMFNVFTKT
jgi:hypothetical protein